MKPQLSNGCCHCDALQGNVPVHNEALSRVVADGADGPDTDGVGDQAVACPFVGASRLTGPWRAAACSQSRTCQTRVSGSWKYALVMSPESTAIGHFPASTPW